MTVVAAPAPAAPAPAAPAPVAHVAHERGAGAHAFASTLETLLAGDGEPKAADKGKDTAEEPADVTPARPPADLRAALVAGALASLPAPQAAGTEATGASTAEDATTAPTRARPAPDSPPSPPPARLTERRRLRRRRRRARGRG